MPVVEQAPPAPAPEAPAAPDLLRAAVGVLRELEPYAPIETKGAAYCISAQALDRLQHAVREVLSAASK